MQDNTLNEYPSIKMHNAGRKTQNTLKDNQSNSYSILQTRGLKCCRGDNVLQKMPVFSFVKL